MDNEMREAIRDVRDQVVSGHAKLETKIDGVGAALASHVVDSAVRTTRVEESTKAAHIRLDTHMKGHWWVLGLVGAIVSGVSVTLIVMLLKLLSKQA